MAARTWSHYCNAWRDWNQFCVHFQSSTPLSLLDLTLSYVAVLMADNFSASHISKVLAGIAFFLKKKPFSFSN